MRESAARHTRRAAPLTPAGRRANLPPLSIMKVRLIRPPDLSVELGAAWGEILRDEPALDSPYFRPEYVQAVAAVRADVEIGVLEDGHRPIGFFPFQRGRGNVARPVGGRLSDLQAIIVRSETPWSVAELLRGCRLSAWEFDHLLTHQAPFKPFHAVVAESPYLDFSRGFEAYKAERRKAGTDEVAHALRKHRKLEREVGPTRFVAHTGDESVFDQLLAWKSQQYRHTNLTDIFRYSWTVDLLKRIWRTQLPGLAGMLSAIYVNDQLLAIHFGMRAGPVLHSWFPAYDRAYSRYSPGLMLLMCLGQAAESLGIRRVDLGKGDEQYKKSFASGSVAVAEGAVDTRPLAGAFRGTWRTMRHWVKSSPHAPVKVPLAWLRKMRDWLAFR